MKYLLTTDSLCIKCQYLVSGEHVWWIWGIYIGNSVEIYSLGHNSLCSSGTEVTCRSSITSIFRIEEKAKQESSMKQRNSRQPLNVCALSKAGEWCKKTLHRFMNHASLLQLCSLFGEYDFICVLRLCQACQPSNVNRKSIACLNSVFLGHELTCKSWSYDPGHKFALLRAPCCNSHGM
jgi:hypothetical protein